MNRFMVLIGLGIFAVASSASFNLASAEVPRWINRPTDQVSIPAGVSWHTTLESGWAESRRRNVPMVIYISTERCKYCDAMKRDTWCDASIQQDLAEGFVAIALTPQENSSTLNRINVETYPTTLIGIPGGKIVAHRDGYQPVAAMKSLLTIAKNRISGK